jgi:hypothetical protein
MAADEPTEPQPEPRQTLAMRLAERQRQRALRAERLARLRGAAAPAAAPGSPAGSGGDDEAEAALEEFLRALTGDRPAPPPPPPPEPGAVLHFQRPERPAPAASPSDLDRLPGAGPGLVWALERAGIRCLADLAPLAPADLVARLGPIGRLVPAEVWLEAARTPPPPT